MQIVAQSKAGDDAVAPVVGSVHVGAPLFDEHLEDFWGSTCLCCEPERRATVVVPHVNCVVFNVDNAPDYLWVCHFRRVQVLHQEGVTSPIASTWDELTFLKEIFEPVVL